MTSSHTPRRPRGRGSISTASRGFVLLAGLIALGAVLGVHRTAEASVVVGKGDPTAGPLAKIARERLAYTSNAVRTVAWEQLVLDDSHGELAWILTVPNREKGGWIENAGDRFLTALDAATAPTIAPAPILGCAASTPREITADGDGPPVRPLDKELFPQGSAVNAIGKLRELGYVVDKPTEARLLSVDALGEDVVVLHLPAASAGATPVVRVLGPPGRPFPLALYENPTSAPSHAHLFLFGANPAQIAGIPLQPVPFDTLSWLGTSSNYASLLENALAKGGQVMPFTSPDAIFADQPTGTVGTTIPSFTRAYFGATDGGATGPWTCAKRAASYGLGGALATVAVSCPETPTWTLADGEQKPPPCVEPPKDAIATTELSCNADDDLAVALGGVVPSRVWLSRLELAAVASTINHGIEELHAGSVPAFHEAKSAGVGACGGGVLNPPGSGGDPTGGGGGSDPNGGAGDPPPQPPSTQVIVHDGCSGTAVFDGCGRSSSSNSTSNDGCSSSSSSGSGGGCGSSSSSSSDSGCGGSSSSSSSDSSCSKGSSSSSSDNGCGGSSSSSSSGGGCGGSSSSSDKGCSIARARVPIRFSPAAYLVVTVATLVRRLGRKRRAPSKDAASSREDDGGEPSA